MRRDAGQGGVGTVTLLSAALVASALALGPRGGDLPARFQGTWRRSAARCRK